MIGVHCSSSLFRTVMTARLLHRTTVCALKQSASLMRRFISFFFLSFLRLFLPFRVWFYNPKKLLSRSFSCFTRRHVITCGTWSRSRAAKRKEEMHFLWRCAKMRNDCEKIRISNSLLSNFAQSPVLHFNLSATDSFRICLTQHISVSSVYMHASRCFSSACAFQSSEISRMWNAIFCRKWVFLCDAMPMRCKILQTESNGKSIPFAIKCVQLFSDMRCATMNRACIRLGQSPSRVMRCTVCASVCVREEKDGNPLISFTTLFSLAQLEEDASNK